MASEGKELLAAVLRAACLHNERDDWRAYYQSWNTSAETQASQRCGSELTVCCNMCGELLRTTLHDHLTGEIHTVTNDLVYDALYTNAGRKKTLDVAIKRLREEGLGDE